MLLTDISSAGTAIATRSSALWIVPRTLFHAASSFVCFLKTKNFPVESNFIAFLCEESFTKGFQYTERPGKKYDTPGVEDILNAL